LGRHSFDKRILFINWRFSFLLYNFEGMRILILLVAATFSGTKEFRPLNREILTQSIGQESAKKKFQKVISSLRQECRGHVFIQEPEPVFPLIGYDSSAISKTASADYRDKGYNYFNGNGYLGHPGVDLLIRDENRDGLDDETKKPCKIVSMTEGVVVDVETKWKPNSNMIDGNFIWIYDFVNHRLVYYAHISKAVIGVGDLVEAGTLLGYVGRTGNNASKSTSPTHLHIMILNMNEENLPVPVNSISFLRTLKSK
jgi:hypothetical protein